MHDTYYIRTADRFIPISSVYDIICWSIKLVEALDHEVYTDTGLPLKVDKTSGLIEYLRKSINRYYEENGR